MVYIIDDEPSVLNALTRVFHGQFNVKTFSLPEEALNSIKGGDSPSIIICDYSLPKMSGFEFLQECCHLCPESVRVIISGHTQINEIAKKFNSNTIHRTLLKPWDNEVLLLQMQEYLQQHNLLTANKSLSEESRKDSLTGVNNRRYFDEKISEEIARCERAETQFTLALIDVDLFKDYNDQYGHLEGDKLIINIAKQIESSVRGIDFVFRYGGDEFAVLLIGSGIEISEKIAERIRANFEKHFSNKMITLSIGLAHYPTHGADKNTLTHFADQMLYKAKKQGGNQTVIAK